MEKVLQNQPIVCRFAIAMDGLQKMRMILKIYPNEKSLKVKAVSTIASTIIMT